MLLSGLIWPLFKASHGLRWVNTVLESYQWLYLSSGTLWPSLQG